MSNLEYNSLTNQLIQTGIIPAQNPQDEIEEEVNMFGIEVDEDMSNSPFQEKEKEDEANNSKRLNQYDLDILNQENTKNNKDTVELIRRFLHLKKSSASGMEQFLFTFFPRLYKAKLVKTSMAKLKALNIDTQKLLDKTIPYGESEIRYENLIKYLSFANEIQTNIDNKMAK